MTPRSQHLFAARVPYAPAGARIGLLGGSFNPAHPTHRMISETALKRLGLNRVWWLVSPGNPLKSHADLAPLERRMAGARRIAATPRIVVTAIEAQLASPYTVDTLRFLRRRLPQVRFVWLMGADNLVQLPRWRQWRQIFALMPVAVVDRPGWHLQAAASTAARTVGRGRVVEARARQVLQRPLPRLVLLTGRLSAESSTAHRARAAQR